MTTGILHTTIGDVYEFIEEYTGEKGVMTHQIPSACRALVPILKTKLPPEWFNEIWLKDGLDEPCEVSDLTDEEKRSYWSEYGAYASAMWDSIKDKTIIVKP